MTDSASPSQQPGAASTGDASALSLPASYFDALYADSTDPWGFETRAYEARKYALTLAALPRAHYESAFEPGCSIGSLSRLLAPRVSRLLATDVAVRAIETARALGEPPNVEFALCHVPAEWPTQDFDLVVFSELGYYFDDADLDRFIIRTAASLRSAGHLIAVHWRPDVADYPRTAATVHDRLRHDSPFVALADYEDEHFLLDVFGASDEAALTGPEDGTDRRS